MANKSRAARWAQACEEIRNGLAALQEIKEEYEDWRGNLPENLDQSPVAEKLDEVIDASGFDEIESAVDELESLDLPLGFGRD